MKVLVGGYCMRGWQGSMLRSMGAIPCSYRGVRGAGSTAKIVEKLNEMDEFILLISPKGTLEAAEWRSGYYQIAKQTGAAVVCGGLDYHSHNLRFGSPFMVDGMELQEVEKRCKNELASVVPHYRAMCEYPLVPLPLEASVMPNERWAVIIPSLLFLLVLLLELFRNMKR